MKFENGFYLYLILLIPVWWVAIKLINLRIEGKFKKAFGNGRYQFLATNRSKFKARTKVILKSLALVFFLIALARPQMGASQTEVKSEGIELMLLVDVSNSMMADDIQPSRLTQAKTELEKLIDYLPGNKVGLIAFAGSATLLSPLTNDPGALKLYIDSLSPYAVSNQGTFFKAALDEAVNAFDRGSGEEMGAKNITRVILVLSDGEDQEKGAVEAVKQLADKNIFVFTMAYGTEKGGAIPERDNFGYLRGYKKDKSGQTILTKTEIKVLQEMAQAGRGEFSFATVGGNHINRFVEKISNMEKSQFDSQIVTQFDDRFQIFLLIGLIFACIDLLIGNRSNPGKIWRGRFEGMLTALILSLIFLQSPKAHADYFTDLYKDVLAVQNNNQAMKSENKKTGDENANSDANYAATSAQISQLLKALAERPDSAELHYNLGVLLASQKKAEDAKKSFETALKKNPAPEIRFASLYNLGVLSQIENKKEEALKYYQEALIINPDSRETKINIELLTGQSKQDQNGKGGKSDEQDSKDKKKDDQNKGDGDGNSDQNKDKNKDDKSDQDKKDKKNEPKSYQKNKPQPKQFKSENLSPGDVQKILGELKQQEQKIRAEFQKKEHKEKPRDKDW